jgi:hypothetical protein
VQTTWERTRKKQSIFTRHQPEETPLYRVIYHYRDGLERCWEERFEDKYGKLRECVLEAFDSYLNCGILLHGCARAYCGNCKHSELIAFSCKRRGLCPSCDAKRALIFAENLHENVLGVNPVRHLVFSLPKRLRVYFKYNRKLTKLLYKAAWDAWSVVTGNLPGKTGMIAALHSAGDLLHFHPHIHSIAIDGTVDENGVFHQLTELDIKKLHDLFQQNVFNALLQKELITQDVVDNMLSWEHSGFNVWSGEPFTDPDTRRFLGRYLKKSPVSLERMSIRDDGKIGITRKTDDFDETRLFDPLEFLAELSSHIPNIWEQTTRYFGIFAARTRGSHATKKLKLKNDTTLLLDQPVEPIPPASKYWATWIKKIYNVDPLLCPKCQAQMRIVAFLHDPKEISAIAKNRGIQMYRAPPPLTASTKAANKILENTIVPIWD